MSIDNRARGEPDRGARRLRAGRQRGDGDARLAGPAEPARRRPLGVDPEGKEYRFRWDLQPDDHVFAAGHRLGLVVVSTDYDYTLRPLPGTQLTLDPGDSELELPVVLGR